MKTKIRENIDEWWDSSFYNPVTGETMSERRDRLLRSEYRVDHVKKENDETVSPMRRWSDKESHLSRRESDGEVKESRKKSEFL